jgi:hypothetical protein
MNGARTDGRRTPPTSCAASRVRRTCSTAPPQEAEFVEAKHAFQHVLAAPTPCQDARLLVELARLWFKHGFTLETEQCYTRALLIVDDEAIRTKLQWLFHAKEGTHPERETKAATAIQSVMKGAIARKQAKKKRMQHQIGATKERAEEKEEQEL